ncbi:hypothetical protein BBAD15_g12047 [Beauveria bassiana D1-5]|uniref:DUF3295 domain-containing protein n=1 Tax=Beauveria bassiana D1-5 TaxID=1245745 RepID=A0A0A2V9I4_BEABA|nr:hypothetical protein BBAD15_g12047 [Beauveria bassiana D1-5]
MASGLLPRQKWRAGEEPYTATPFTEVSEEVWGEVATRRAALAAWRARAAKQVGVQRQPVPAGTGVNGSNFRGYSAALGPLKIKQHVIAASHNFQLKAECAIDPDTEDDYVNESAINGDDDPSDWEDSMEHSGKSSIDDMFFQRVESKARVSTRLSSLSCLPRMSARRTSATHLPTLPQPSPDCAQGPVTQFCVPLIISARAR